MMPAKRIKPRKAYIGSARSAASACPNCAHKLDGFTGVKLDQPVERPVALKGHPTMCCYCGALLTFADDAGRVRMMTVDEYERATFDPIIAKLLDDWRREHAPDFTKKRYN